MKFETISKIMVMFLIFSVLLYYALYAYAIAMTPDGMLIEEHEIKDICIKNGDVFGKYEAVIKGTDSKYELWNIPIGSKFIISNESKITKLTQISRTDYIIYYPEIKLCRT